jgi:uncharacterized membrane protein
MRSLLDSIPGDRSWLQQKFLAVLLLLVLDYAHAKGQLLPSLLSHERSVSRYRLLNLLPE